MLKRLLAQLAGGGRRPARTAEAAARGLACLRAGRVGDALRELAPLLDAAHDSEPLRVLRGFAGGRAADYAERDDWRRDVAYLLGAALLSLQDEEGAAECARIAWTEPGATYRGFDLGIALPDHCRGEGFACLQLDHIASSPLGARGLAHQVREAAWLCALPGGMVLGRSFLPATEAELAFTQRCIESEPKLARLDGIEQFDLLRLASEARLWTAPAEIDRYPGRHVLIGNHANFGHWLIYYFARLRLLEEAPQLADAKLVVGDDLLPLHLDCLRRAGFDAARLVRLPKGRFARFDELWVPSVLCWSAADGRWFCAPEAVRYLRRALGASAPRGGGARRLYLARRDARWRRLLNEDEIVRALAPLGFEAVDAARLDLDEQLALAAAARIVVGPLGAGLNLHLFAGEGVPLVQLQPEAEPRMNIHVALAGILEQPLHQVIGEMRSRDPDPLKRDFTVSPASVIDAVSRALATG